ncbi:MAG: DUF2177 family protein [Coxiellaceae bacterium]|nr:DUF2177 family protein [Coxiellaceae bacterium]
MNLIKSFVCTVVIFLIMDALWLGVIAKKIYIHYLGSVLRMHNGAIDARWPAAVLVYLALVVGIMVFVIPKAAGHPLWALLYGALFGFITYAIYDGTNLAVLANWSIPITIIDILWGMVICGVTSALVVWIGKV